MQQADRNRIDRLPTTGERWVGIVLSALIAIVCLAACILVLFIRVNATSDGTSSLILATILGLLGGVGSFLFYRIAFTTPRAASPQANQIFAYVAVAVAILMTAIFIATPTPIPQRFMAVSLLVAALGYLAVARKKSVGSGRK